MKTKHEPQVTRQTVFSMQVCVPKRFTYEQIRNFANGVNPSGTRGGWIVRKKPDKGEKARQLCEERSGCVHVVLDA